MLLLSKLLKTPDINDEILIKCNIEKISAHGQELLASDSLIKNAEKKAQEILNEARNKAQEIINSAEEQLKSRLVDGYKHGHEQGYQEGLAEARLEALSRYEEIKKALQSVYELRQKIITDVEEDLKKLSISIAERIITKQLAMEPEIIFDIVKEACGQFRQAEQITIFVNPDDGYILRQRKSEFQEILGDYCRIYIIDDGGLSQGSCIIESENGLIDAGLKTQLEKLGLAILGDE